MCKSVSWLLLLTLVVWSCKPLDQNDEESNEYLVSYNLLTATPISAATLASILDLLDVEGAQGFASSLVSDVNIYKVVYRTSFQNKSVEASGACLVPVSAKAGGLNVLSYQHGTIFRDADLPSAYTNLWTMNQETMLNLFFASAGWFCVMPDYIGYGVSRDILHPYINAEASSRACLDMLHAAKELAVEIGVDLANRYYLNGYSEGAYATLALLKRIQQLPAGQFQVAATSVGAGPYDILKTAQVLLGQSVLTSPAFAAFVVYSYHKTMGWDRDLGEVFRSPYRELIEGGLFKGQYDSQAINAQLTTDKKKLFSESFLSGLSGQGETALKEAFVSNSLVSGWLPASPLRLFHGSADLTVPFVNSSAAYQQFSQAGAVDLQLVPLAGLDHGTAIIPWALSTFAWFQGY